MAFGGLLAGVIAALVLGARGAVVASGRELHALYPFLTVVQGAELRAVVTIETEADRTLYVTAVGGDPSEFASRVVDPAVGWVSQAERRGTDPYPAGNVALSQRSAAVQVVPADPRLLARISSRPDATVMIGVVIGKARLRQLDGIGSVMPDGTYLVVDE